MHRFVSHAQPSARPRSHLRKGYAEAAQKWRNAILDELAAVTGYYREHAGARLSGQRQCRNPAQSIRRRRHATHPDADQKAVFWLVALLDDFSSLRWRAGSDSEFSRCLDISFRYHFLMKLRGGSEEWGIFIFF